MRRTLRFAAVAVICIGSDILLPARPGLALASLVYLFWAAWITKTEAKSAPLILNPLVCYQAWQMAVLGFAPLYVSLTNTGSSVRLGNQQVELEWVAFGHAIMVAGSCSFYAGMKRFQPSETPSNDVASGSASPLFVTLAVLVGSVFLVGRDVITEYAGSTVAQFTFLPVAVLCIVATDAGRSGRRSANTRLWIVLIGSLWLLLLNSRRDSKMELILSFIPLIWLLLVQKRHVWLTTGAVLLTAFYLLVVAPLVSEVRRVVLIHDDTGTIRVITPDDTAGVLIGMGQDWSADPAAYLQSWLDQTMLRMCDPVAAGLVASLVDIDGFMLGRRFDYVLLAFIPRAVWPDKPKVNRGAIFSSELGMISESGVAITATGETSAGELYWNFGWPGVILGMYVLGAALSGFWWRAAGSDPRRGVLEMTAYTGAMLSFVLGVGAAAGPLFITCVSAGILWRVLIAVGKKVRTRGTLRLSTRRLRAV